MPGWIARGDDEELLDIDEQQLTAAIVKVVIAEVATQTRAALNAAVGRLD